MKISAEINFSQISFFVRFELEEVCNLFDYIYNIQHIQRHILSNRSTSQYIKAKNVSAYILYSGQEFKFHYKIVLREKTILRIIIISVDFFLVYFLV